MTLCRGNKDNDADYAPYAFSLGLLSCTRVSEPRQSKNGPQIPSIFPPSGTEGGIETAIDLFVSGAAGLSPPLSSSGAFVTSPAAPIDRLACLVGGARRPLLIFTAGGGGGGKDETNGR